MSSGITLLICGNQVASAGFVTLLTVGKSPLEKEDIPYSPRYASSKYCIRIKHTPQYITYSLVCNPSIIRSYGASRDGYLSFSLTIDRGYKLVGGKSPFDLLISLRNDFMKRYMTLSMDGAYTFKPGIYDSLPLCEILSNVNLEQSKRYVEMQGGAEAYVAVKDEEQIRCFLRDSHYSELSSYSSVWIGVAASEEGSLNLEIPRVPEYEVYVNGQSKGYVPGGAVFKKVFSSGKNYTDDVKIEFTPEQLNSSWTNPNVSSFSKDECEEKITFEVTYPKKGFKRFFVFDFGNMSSADIEIFKNHLQLISSSAQKKDIAWADNSVTVTFWGEEIDDEWAFSSGDDYSCKLKDNPFVEDINPLRCNVSVTCVFRGFKVCGISPELVDKPIALAVYFRNRKTSFCEVQQVMPQAGVISFRPSDINVNDLASISRLQLTCEGYDIEEPVRGKLKGGWYCIAMPSFEKKKSTAKPAPMLPNNTDDVNGELKHLTFNGLDDYHDCTVAIQLDNSSRYVKLLKDDGYFDNVVELPKGREIEKIVYRVRGYRDFSQNEFDSTKPLAVPPMKKRTLWDYLLKFNLIQYILVFILAFVFGAGAFYHFEKKHPDFTRRIIGSVSASGDNGSNAGGAGGSTSEEDDKDENADTGAGIAEDQQSIFQPGDDKQQVQVKSQVESQAEEYIKFCENATLEFDKIESLGNFLKDISDHPAKLDIYYAIYRDAYAALRELVPVGPDDFYDGTLDIFYKKCDSINVRAKKYDKELLSFRKNFQRIYLKDKNGRNVLFVYLKNDPSKFDFKQYNSFSKIEEFESDKKKDLDKLIANSQSSRD